MSTPNALPVLDGARVDLVLGTSQGGIGRHVSALCTALVNANAAAIVHGPSNTETTFRFTNSSAAFEPVGIESGLALLSTLRAIRTLSSQLTDATLVHAHGIRAGMVGARALAQLPQRPAFVVTWHNVPTVGPAVVQRQLERQLARAADVCLVVSPDLQARITACGAGDVRVIPVGAELLPEPRTSPTALRAELDLDNRPVILTVGRLHEQKGLDVLIDAASTWQQRTPRPVLLVAGNGPQRQALRDRALARGVDVHWLGYVDDRALLAALLATADISVVPSRWEGSPLAVHEALMAGRPVVVTAVGGLPSLLHDDEVAFVPPEDPRALAAAIGSLLDDPNHARRLGERGRAAATRWPDSATSAAQVLDVYAELLSRPAR